MVHAQAGGHQRRGRCPFGRRSRRLSHPQLRSAAPIRSWSLSTAEQNRSKGRRKTGPFSVMRYAVLRVVPLVHRRAPRCFV